MIRKTERPKTENGSLTFKRDLVAAIACALAQLRTVDVRGLSSSVRQFQCAACESGFI